MRIRQKQVIAIAVFPCLIVCILYWNEDFPSPLDHF